MHYIYFSKTPGERADSEDLREWPLSSLTAKDAVRARQPSSLHTPSHLRVWLVFHTGNCHRYTDRQGRRLSGVHEDKKKQQHCCACTKRFTEISVETPRSVSLSELHGNWPVTLYRLTETLKVER